MKTILFFFFAFVLNISQAAAITEPGNYRFYLDLNAVEDDKLQVRMTPPVLAAGEVIYRIPKIIPGTYSIFDFGRFVSDFKVTPKPGMECKVEQLDANSWRIGNASQIAEITYVVDDTWDAADRTNWIFEPAGTNIDAGKNFVLNNHGFIGYFDGMAMVPYTLSVTRPASFYGSTGLNFTSTGNTDVFSTANYHILVDSPIMYNEPDTTVIRVGNANVLVSVYNDNRMISSAFIARNISEVLNAQKEYLGGTLPVEKYAFIIYIPSNFSSFNFGALEHNNSSFYFLPAFGEDYLAQMVKDISAHEFFHIVTPLTIHSEEIHYFDYNTPKMSKHLWLYEGVTEYSASHVQVKYGLINFEDYLQVLMDKITGASVYNDTVPFTVMSENCLDVYKSQYGNVYQKGALIGLCLDLQLLKSSGGKYGLQQLLKDLAKKYGRQMPFKDDELFDVITAMTYPEIGEFFRRYVAGPEPLPLRDMLLYAGVDFSDAGTRETIDLGVDFVSAGFDERLDRYYIFSADELSPVGKALGFRTGDFIETINGQVVNKSTVLKLLTDLYGSAKPADTITYEITREETKGKKTKITRKKITGRIGTMTQAVEAGLSPVQDPTDEQLMIRGAWIGN